MKPLQALRLSWGRRLAVILALAVVAGVTVTPGLGFSKGICTDCAGGSKAPDGDFVKIGCVACHGEVGKFRPVDNSIVTYQFRDAQGGFLNGPYAAEATYTITIHINEEVAPDGGSAGNHAGFNLRTSGGAFSAVADQSQVSGDGKQATHVDAKHTTWNVTWKAPASGAVSFQLFVNDVDGSGDPNAPDTPHELFFGLTDKDGAILGAAAKVEAPEFGISLQQYWIGLIGLLGMIFIMVAGFVYLKFVNPHNTDQKDR